VTGAAGRAEIFTHQAQFGPERDGLNMIDLRRRHYQPTFLAEAAERCFGQHHQAQPPPRNVVAAGRGRTTLSAERLQLCAPRGLRVVVRRAVQWRTKRHQTSGGNAYAEYPPRNNAAIRHVFALLPLFALCVEILTWPASCAPLLRSKVGGFGAFGGFASVTLIKLSSV
jgi:hypothetical protein